MGEKRMRKTEDNISEELGDNIKHLTHCKGGKICPFYLSSFYGQTKN